MANEDFEFRFDAPIIRVTDDEILEPLRAFARVHDNHPFTTREKGEISEGQLLGTTQPRKQREVLPLKDRWEVLKRDNYRCIACGRRPPDVELEVDHIIPIARGGTDDPANHRTLCRACNQGKKDR